jgi:uncharacterized protein (DUF1684 family)
VRAVEAGGDNAGLKPLGPVAWPMTDDTEAWAARLRENRREKDRFFAEHRQSPIPPGEREEFDGLDYVDPDPAYRVEASVTVHDDPEPVEMTVSDGPPTRYERVVTFVFELDGETHDLHGYRKADEDSGIFVPFRDETTGQETDGGGRYLDLEPEGDLSTVETVTLDFNLAYTPFCAFNDAFACPLPPEENWLETTIEAGERGY